MRRWAMVLACLMPAMMAAPAGAQPASPPATPPPTSQLPLGFAKLHWGMSVDDAKALYPTLRPGAQPSTQSLEGYSYNTCNFAVVLTFAQDKLSAIALDAAPAKGVLQCADQIRAELGARYVGLANNLYYPDRSVTEHFQESWYGPGLSAEINALAANGALAIRFRSGK